MWLLWGILYTGLCAEHSSWGWWVERSWFFLKLKISLEVVSLDLFGLAWRGTEGQATWHKDEKPIPSRGSHKCQSTPMLGSRWSTDLYLGVVAPVPDVASWMWKTGSKRSSLGGMSSRAKQVHKDWQSFKRWTQKRGSDTLFDQALRAVLFLAAR